MAKNLATQLLSKMEQQAEQIEIIPAEQAAHNLMLIEREKVRIKFKIALFYTIFSVFMFIFGNIYVQRYKFPLHFRWWDVHKYRDLIKKNKIIKRILQLKEKEVAIFYVSGSNCCIVSIYALIAKCIYNISVTR